MLLSSFAVNNYESCCYFPSHPSLLHPPFWVNVTWAELRLFVWVDGLSPKCCDILRGLFPATQEPETLRNHAGKYDTQLRGICFTQGNPQHALGRLLSWLSCTYFVYAVFVKHLRHLCHLVELRPLKLNY